MKILQNRLSGQHLEQRITTIPYICKVVQKSTAAKTADLPPLSISRFAMLALSSRPRIPHGMLMESHVHVPQPTRA
jgi:hypothetical protein